MMRHINMSFLLQGKRSTTILDREVECKLMTFEKVWILTDNAEDLKHGLYFIER